MDDRPTSKVVASLPARLEPVLPVHRRQYLNEPSGTRTWASELFGLDWIGFRTQDSGHPIQEGESQVQ